VAPRSIAHDFISEATASAVDGSSLLPVSIVARSEA
jgi:hypothetical protein